MDSEISYKLQEKHKMVETSKYIFYYRIFNSYEELVKDFEEGLLHPGDLKPAVARVINELIEPVRKHFETDPQAKALINKIKSFKK